MCNWVSFEGTPFVCGVTGNAQYIFLGWGGEAQFLFEGQMALLWILAGSGWRNWERGWRGASGLTFPM